MNEHDTLDSAKPEDPELSHALKPGRVIMEYVIEKTLGCGSFGITYLARDENLNLPVAIKEYLPTDLAMRSADDSVQTLGSEFDDQFRWGLERFLSEARVLATFRHPNIVRVLRYFAANGTAYIVMEFESGESLKKWLPRQDSLNESALIKLIHPLLDGLEIIHNASYLHRDIKPDNIYIRADNSPVLIDFGSARSTSADRELTSIVSPGFAPFEQYLSNGNQGPWTDLYALAAVMYWLISGTKPLSSIERMKQDDIIPATRLELKYLISESLLITIDWALNVNETRRPQSVAEFRSRLYEAERQSSTSPMPETIIPLPTAWVGTTPSGKEIIGAETHTTNLVCSILFMDIVAYSKASVNEQYQLKLNFNQLIAGKLAHIPEGSRITLDSGDGAVICFMGDPEEVLYAARNIQCELAEQTRLNVRMGLHIGPIRIIKDLNGHKNVIGDGINVGQRVMSFAESNRLVVSRAFYDIVVCLADGGEREFSYLGERRDKHDRIHQIYAVVNKNEIERSGDNTIRMNENPAIADLIMDQDMLIKLEKDLARHLGPLSAVLIRKLRPRVTSESELRKLLAQSIGDPTERESFLQAVHSHSQNHDNSSPPHSASSPNQRLTELVPVNATQSSGTPQSTSSGSFPPWITPECTALLEEHLAHSIGPIAKMLVNKEVGRADSLGKLCEALSMHIDNPESRSHFLKKVTSTLKLRIKK
jgi:serine/threonine protein kinase